MAPVPRSSHPILDSLGVTIRLLRQQRGLSQEALAHLAEIDRSYMSGIERGRRNISLLNMARIAAALRVALPELLTSAAAGHTVAIAPAASVEHLQRASDAVDDLAATLRLYHEGRTMVDEWKPGEYLSLS
jgi:transcriptional regulator with XRE-family HTH domain